MVNVTPIHDEESELYEKVEAELEEEILKAEEEAEAEEEEAEEIAEAIVEELLEEASEAIIAAAAAAEAEENDDDYEDEEEEEEDDDEDDEFEEDVSNETFMERIIALKGVIPPSYRYGLTNVSSTLYSAASTTLKYSGSAIWILTTSSLLLGVPLTLSVISEQQLIEMEKEMKLTQSTNELLAPGAESGFQQVPAGSL